MTDTIDAVRADLARAGNPEQVQWSGAQTSWDEGTIVCVRDGDAVVLRRLGRDESGDRIEHYDSEAEAAGHLRRTLLDVPVRRLTTAERTANRERMKRRAAETKARLRADRHDA